MPPLISTFREFSKRASAPPSCHCLERLERSEAIERLERFERLERTGPRDEQSAAVEHFERPNLERLNF